MKTFNEEIERHIIELESEISALRQAQRVHQRLTNTRPEDAAAAFHVLNRHTNTRGQKPRPRKAAAEVTIQRVINFVLNNSPCNVAQIAESIPMSRSTIQWGLRYGVERGLLERIGPGKYSAIQIVREQA